MMRTTLALTCALSLLLGTATGSGAQEREVQVWSVSSEASGWIGVSLQQTSYTMLSGDVVAEVVIERVWEGSPAEAAGILPGDRILRVNGEVVDPAHSMEQLKTRPGDSVNLVVLRDGEEVTVELIAAERPGPMALVRGPTAVSWTTDVDSLTRKILLTADSLKVNLRLLDGKGPAVYSGDSLVFLQPERVEATTVHVRRGNGEEIELVRPGSEMRFEYRVSEGNEPAPFGVFVARTPETDSLLTQRSRLRAEIERVRATEAERRTELARTTSSGEARVSEEDPRLVGLVKTREKLASELVAVEEELARTSLEVLARRSDASEPSAVSIRELPEAPRVRSLFPYLVGERFVAGAELTNLNPELAEYFPASRGVLVTEVVPGSPAHEAGLKGGDIIVRVGDMDVDSVDSLRRALSRSGRDRPATITVADKNGTRVIELKR